MDLELLETPARFSPHVVIPPHIREQLLRWYDPSVLDTARYKVSDNGQFSAATAMLQNPDVGAVTLIDIILFRDAQTAEQDAIQAEVRRSVREGTY